MADTFDYYKELGIDRNADEEAIKKAFRALALKYHPDRNPDNKKAEDRFKRANRANEVLSDPKKRALYDEFGEINQKHGSANSFMAKAQAEKLSIKIANHYRAEKLHMLVRLATEE